MGPNLKVCLICTELFGRGTFGGFGRATRFIGRELVRRNVQVSAVVPMRDNAGTDPYQLDGITIYSYRPKAFLSSIALYRQVDADIYHSQDVSLGTYLAMWAKPDKRHVVTFRDPLDQQDWRTELFYSGSKLWGWLKSRIYVDNFLVARAVRKADAVFCAAPFLGPKARDKFHLQQLPGHLPTPVDIPEPSPKAAEPTVCAINRWHRRKRPERFFELAARFPRIRFIFVGGTSDRQYEAEMRARYGPLPNLEIEAPIDQFTSDRLAQILDASWILVNTAAREGLPSSFLEAAAHGCAILSEVDPEGFASRFGYHAQQNDLADGLMHLLDSWREAGQRGREFVRTVYATPLAMEAHLEAYRAVLALR
jgi:glycosyltransferase involved in cell wall biosynthesis